MSPDEFKLLRLSIFMTPEEIGEILTQSVDESFDGDMVKSWEACSSRKLPILAEKLINALNWAVSNYAQDLEMRARENPNRPLLVTLYDDQDTFRNHAEEGRYLLHYKMHRAAVSRAQETLEGTKVFIRSTYYPNIIVH